MRITFSILCLLLASACIASDVDSSKDPRLAKPVTIECVNTRLHTVLEQLSDKTGVAIRCGRDKRDWQVRDIPVTVCAKDLPLGTLLKSIAASTHLLLSKEQVGQMTIYRIWRDRKRQNQLDDYLKAKDAADFDAISWDWDALCKMKDAPASNASQGSRRDLHTNLAGVLSSLGLEGRNKVLSGGYIRCTLGNTAESVHGYMSNVWQGMLVSHPSAPRTPTPEDLQRSGMVVYLGRDADGVLQAWVSAGVDFAASEPGGSGMQCRSTFPITPYSAADQKLVDMSNRPAAPKMPALDAPDGDWQQLSPLVAFDLPILLTKVTLEPPKNKDAVTCGSLLAALSKATGFAVICEDFASHRKTPSPIKLFAKDITAKAVLEGLEAWSPSRLPQSDFVWHINEKDKVIIGTANSWPHRHTNLVSEGFMDYLRNKLNGDGVGLDDYLKVMALSRGQMDEWIKYAPDLAILDAYGHPSHKEFWMLYDSLSPQQRTQAMTESGLPMRDMQPAYVAYLISCYNQDEADRVHHDPLRTTEPNQFPYDEQNVAGLVMKVVKKTEPHGRNMWSRGSGESLETSTWPQGSFMVDTYEMTIEVIQDGKTHALCLGGPTGLPYYSPEREKALGIKPVE